MPKHPFNFPSRRRMIAAVAAATLLIAGGSGAAVAFAKSHHHVDTRIANSCHTQVQENVQWPLDTSYRVVAWCDSLEPGTQARGVLDTRWDVDKHTDWFSDIGVKHYSDWKIPLFSVNGSRIEYSASNN